MTLPETVAATPCTGAGSQSWTPGECRSNRCPEAGCWRWCRRCCPSSGPDEVVADLGERLDRRSGRRVDGCRCGCSAPRDCRKSCWPGWRSPGQRSGCRSYSQRPRRSPLPTIWLAPAPSCSGVPMAGNWVGAAADRVVGRVLDQDSVAGIADQRGGRTRRPSRRSCWPTTVVAELSAMMSRPSLQVARDPIAARAGG